MAAYRYVYVMKGLTGAHPGARQVLNDIWPSFLPGAKIGVLGAEADRPHRIKYKPLPRR